MSPFLAWGDFHARSRFVRSTIPEEKWGTTPSLPSTRHNQLFTRNCKCDKLLVRGSYRIIDHLLTLFNLRMRQTKVNTMVRTTSDKQTSGTFQGQLKVFKD